MDIIFLKVFRYNNNKHYGLARQPWDDEVVSIAVLTLVKVNSCIVFRRTLAKV